MGRKCLRDLRRQEILEAFAKVLANHGYAGATTVAVAEAAGLAPGLLHHHFSSKQEMLGELMKSLIGGFHQRVAHFTGSSGVTLESYIDAALKLGQNADTIAAKCWVGLFAEALRDASLYAQIKRHLEAEVDTVSGLTNPRLSEHDASALIAYILGALVFGAFAPRKAQGFAAPGGKALAAVLSSS